MRRGGHPTPQWEAARELRNTSAGLSTNTPKKGFLTVEVGCKERAHGGPWQVTYRVVRRRVARQFSVRPFGAARAAARDSPGPFSRTAKTLVHAVERHGTRGPSLRPAWGVAPRRSPHAAAVGGRARGALQRVGRRNTGAGLSTNTPKKGFLTVEVGCKERAHGGPWQVTYRWVWHRVARRFSVHPSRAARAAAWDTPGPFSRTANTLVHAVELHGTSKPIRQACRHMPSRT